MNTSPPQSRLRRCLSTQYTNWVASVLNQTHLPLDKTAVDSTLDLPLKWKVKFSHLNQELDRKHTTFPPLGSILGADCTRSPGRVWNCYLEVLISCSINASVLPADKTPSDLLSPLTSVSPAATLSLCNRWENWGGRGLVTHSKGPNGAKPRLLTLVVHNGDCSLVSEQTWETSHSSLRK